MEARTMARALGWFSIGLGLSELAAPRSMAGATGLNYSPALLRLLGAREIATGVAILSRPGSTAAMSGRVAGDAMDLALIGAALNAARGDERRKLIAAAVAVAGVTVLDAYCTRALAALPENRLVRFKRSITIARDPESLYRYWRDYSNLPRIMPHLESVRSTGSNRWHWVGRAPAGYRFEWDTEDLDDRPGALIAWRSIPGGDLETTGTMRFEPTRGNETVVHHEVRYSLPAGTLGAGIARLLGRAPEQEISGALRRLKQLMETGEIATAQGPAARSHPPLFERIGGSMRTDAIAPPTG